METSVEKPEVSRHCKDFARSNPEVLHSFIALYNFSGLLLLRLEMTDSGFHVIEIPAAHLNTLNTQQSPEIRLYAEAVIRIQGV